MVGVSCGYMCCIILSMTYDEDRSILVKIKLETENSDNRKNDRQKDLPAENMLQSREMQF